MLQEDKSQLKYWLGLNLVKGIGPARFESLVRFFGSPMEAWQANLFDLKAAGLDRRTAENLYQMRSTVDLDLEMERVQSQGIEMITWQDGKYPRLLKEIANPPPLLYVRGELLPSDEWAIAVVGTRRSTAYGRQIAQELVASLAHSGITIISGLAKGIDSIAHRAALDAGGRTIAVLGSGLDITYPSENRTLSERIASDSGAVISEYSLGTPPDAGNFPARNRIVSGMSLGALVVEAGVRSGALITANLALEQDREVFAVPGNVNSPASKGTNRLIQQGAKLVHSVEDILEELNLTMVPQQTAAKLIVPDSAEEALLLSYLSHQPVHIDEIIRKANIPTGMVGSTLALMELKGMVRQVGGMNYVLAREPQPEYINEPGGGVEKTA